MGLVSQIAGALFPSAAAAPSVRRPGFEAQFGGASADDWALALVAFSVDSGLAPWADGADLYLSAKRGPACSIGDSGSLSAGYEDSSKELLFSGQVISVQDGIEGITRIGAANGGAVLSRLRVNQAYEQSTAGDIVNDLAQKASVDAGSIESGATYAYYAIDDRRSAWQHIAALARKNGFLAWFSSEGTLNFKPVEAGQPAQTFTYGVDILALRRADAVLPAGQVTVVGEGAAGSSGQDAWCWLVKDASAVTSQSGQGDPVRLVVDASLRSGEAVAKAADGISAAAQAATATGWLLAPGAPAVAPGSMVEIAGAPDGALSGTYLVHRVLHRFGKFQGFTTLMYFTRSGAGGGPGAAGGLLAAAKGLL